MIHQNTLNIHTHPQRTPLTFNEAVACDESQITWQPGLNNGILATGIYLDSDLPSLEQ